MIATFVKGTDDERHKDGREVFQESYMLADVLSDFTHATSESDGP